MLNKKTVFHLVYAIALFGAFTACISLLNEFLQITQLYSTYVRNLNEFTEKSFWVPFSFYLISFLVCSFGMSIVVLYELGKIKNKKLCDLCLLICSGAVFVLSMLSIYFLRYSNSYYQTWILDNTDYLSVYTLRTCIMSYIGNIAVVLGCHLIDAKCVKKQAVEDAPTEE